MFEHFEKIHVKNVPTQANEVNLARLEYLNITMKEIRPLSEQGVIVWNSGLTKAQVRQLENIQKVALKIILGDDYSDYLMACKTSGISTLSSRRSQLCSNFAVKLYKSKRCEEYFTKLQPKSGTRNLSKLVKENTCRTKRCFNAPHNYLNRLVNANISKIIHGKQKL